MLKEEKCVNCNGVVGPPVDKGWCQYCIDIFCDEDIEKQKKGSSEEKIWKDYLNHVKKKQKKGCGKHYCDNKIWFNCGDRW